MIEIIHKYLIFLKIYAQFDDIGFKEHFSAISMICFFLFILKNHK